MVDIPKEGTHGLIAMLEMEAWRKHWAGTRVRKGRLWRHKTEGATQRESLPGF